MSIGRARRGSLTGSRQESGCRAQLATYAPKLGRRLPADRGLHLERQPRALGSWCLAEVPHRHLRWSQASLAGGVAQRKLPAPHPGRLNGSGGKLRRIVDIELKLVSSTLLSSRAKSVSVGANLAPPPVGLVWRDLRTSKVTPLEHSGQPRCFSKARGSPRCCKGYFRVLFFDFGLAS